MIPLRDENPLRNRAPVITVLLVVANVVFLYELSLGTRAERLVYEFGLLPVEANRSLPPDIKRRARAAYRLWTRDPRHPSLRFKKCG
jgi:hypothetical protein